MRFVIEATPADLAKVVAEEFIHLAREATLARSRFAVALSGGKTPNELYSCLGRTPFLERVDWRKTHLFWSDERLVAPSDPESNFRSAMDAFGENFRVPRENVHRMPGELKPDAAAAIYENQLKDFFNDDPSFDLVLLGLGTDAHTASLFPNRPTLAEKKRWVIADRVNATTPHRLTLTLPVINSSRTVAFLVTGAAKAGVVSDVILGPLEPDRKPAQLVAPLSGSLVWCLDREAASLLPNGRRKLPLPWQAGMGKPNDPATF